MNGTSCPRRFGWIDTNWRPRINLSSTVQLNASGRSSSFPVSERMSLSKHRADLDLHLLMRNLRAWSDSQIATLYPGCFALVMATGIISNALFFEGRREWSDALFAVNLIAYPWLALITIVRFLRFRQALRSDLFNPRLVFSFFTIVAGTDVFGVGLHLRGFTTAALFLWVFALLVWFILIYFSFAVLTFLNTAHGANVVHGGWLIAIVGTQSLVILGTLIAPAVGDLGRTVFVLIHMLWGVGLALYGIFIVLFAHRIFFGSSGNRVGESNGKCGLKPHGYWVAGVS